MSISNCVFQVQDLAVASPATVSRCGMVYVDPDELKWKPYVQTWISGLGAKVVRNLSPSYPDHLEHFHLIFGPTGHCYFLHYTHIVRYIIFIFSQVIVLHLWTQSKLYILYCYFIPQTNKVSHVICSLFPLGFSLCETVAVCARLFVHWYPIRNTLFLSNDNLSI